MRIYTSASDPLDFCHKHAPSEKQARKLYGLEQCGEGPDNRGDCFGYDDDHPSYNDDMYKCETCGRQLTDKD